MQYYFVRGVKLVQITPNFNCNEHIMLERSIFVKMDDFLSFKQQKGLQELK